MKKIPDITIEALIDRYDVLLFDAYGVLVHTSGALPGAGGLIRHLNRTGKPYYIVTNDASKLPETASRQYRGYGLEIDPGIMITSGALLVRYFEKNRLKGVRCVVLGPEDSVRYVEQAGGKVVAADLDFDVLVIADEAGFAFMETVDAALTSLCRVVDRKQDVHLILPNPDLIYPKADRGLGFAAGSIAGMFEAALKRRYSHRGDLTFVRLGKPETGLFEAASARSGTRNMVMIGDQLETDICGARAFGIDTAWVETGVTAKTSGVIPVHLRPTYRLSSLGSF